MAKQSEREIAESALYAVVHSAGTPHGQYVSFSADEADLVRRLLRKVIEGGRQ